MNLWPFLLLVNLTYIIGQGVPECSDTYIQIFRNMAGLEGRIFLPISVPRYSPSVKMTVSFTLANTEVSSYGRLGLLYGKDEAMRQIESASRKPLIYQVIFPVEASRIYFHDIIVNDNIYCKNPEENIPARSTRTITLTHTLYQIQGLNVGGGTWIRTTERPNLEPEVIFEQPTISRPRPQPTDGGFSIVFGANPTSFWPSPGNREPPNLGPVSPTRPRPQPNEEDFEPPTSRPRPRPSPTPRPTIDTPRPTPDAGEINDQEICGTLLPRPLIANGEDYNRGDWPWLAALFSETRTGNNFFCGGSLLSPRFVITAAHCLQSNGTSMRKEQIVVIMGKHLVRSLTERQIQSRNVNRYYVHQEFNHTTLYADIAILELSEEVTYSAYVRPLCIWRVADELSSVVGQVGTIAGWGRDENGSPITDTPKRVRVPIISNDQCRNSHRQYRIYVNDKNFCGGYRNGSSPCTGDSGGGLALKLGNQDRWILRGIVSYSLNDGSGECNTRQYTVFTDAAKFTNWIVDTIST